MKAAAVSGFWISGLRDCRWLLAMGWRREEWRGPADNSPGLARERGAAYRLA